MLSEPPLVGRDEELGRLDEILNKAISGQGGLVLLAGEAGIGKTRLATEFDKQAKMEGCKVLIGNCLPSAQIPYLVFLEALNHLFDDKEQQKISRSQKLTKAARKAAPDLMKAIPVIGSTMKASAKLFEKYSDGKRIEVSKEHVLFRTLEILTEESSRTPLILHLDDLQWADSMSIAMLHFLARNCKDLRVMLLGTYRSEEVFNQEAGIHPLLDSIRVMKREGIVQELNLKPLAEKEMDIAVSSMLEMPVDERLLARIFKESGGSPLFAVETVRLLLNSNVLTVEGGVYKVKGRIEDLVPTSVLEVITRRIERLSREDKKVLDFASVIGIRFDPNILADAMNTNSLRVLESLEDLGDYHQLVREVGDGYAFSHEKVRKITYDSISRIRRKELHRSIGLTIERKTTPYSNIYGILAEHFLGAGDDVRFVMYSVLAGEMSFLCGAASEAINHFEQASTRISDDNETKYFRLTALRNLAEAKWDSNDFPGSVMIYEECLRMGIDEGHKGPLLSGLANSMYAKGEIRAALELMDKAKRLPWHNEVELAIFKDTESTILTSEGDFETAIGLVEDAETLFKKYGLWHRLVRSMMLHLVLCLSLGMTEKAIELGRKGQEIMAKYNIEYYENYLLGIAFIHKGEYELALEYLNKDIVQCERVGRTTCAPMMWQTDILEALGNYEEAFALAMKARDVAEHDDDVNTVVEETLSMIHYLLVTGREDEARKLFDNLEKILKSRVPVGLLSHTTDARIELIRAELDLYSGLKGEADQRFQLAINGQIGYYKIYNIALFNKWYGEILLKTGYIEEGKTRLKEAAIHFSKLTNDYQVKKLKTMIESLSR